MTEQGNDLWKRNLAGHSVGKYSLTKFIGAGRIGYVYHATHRDIPDSERAVKLVFGSPRQGWDVELRKVLNLSLVDGVVHFHELDTELIRHDSISEICQYTVWDYIAPGENLKNYLKRVGKIETSFLLAVVERILHVMHACDTRGVIRHGDLHSGNILIGDESLSKLDDSLQPRAPVYVSDFGYGVTGGHVVPKDDAEGLSRIINEMIPKVDYSKTTATHRRILQAMQRDFGKLLREPSGPERRKPIELLRILADIKRSAQTGTKRSGGSSESGTISFAQNSQAVSVNVETPSVGQFQVSEMIGDRWDWWRRLFVPTVPARSKILALDIPTVVTGPRGCGKTMFFRRLSERLIVECGAVEGIPSSESFVAFYVNANDFADAFAHFPENPTPKDEERLTCYANLCVLAEVLAVQSARSGSQGDHASAGLLELVHQLLIPPTFNTLIVGEDRLERYRAVLEQIKWTFPMPSRADPFPGHSELSQHRWLSRFVQTIREHCAWIGNRSVLLFVDDFSTPRVSSSMQRVLNRLFLQRSSDFLAKVATEAWSTFVPEDSSGKNLQDGDDYQLIDMGEESLFLPDNERLAFLNDVFTRRLSLDPRIPGTATSLRGVLGLMGLSKTEFARRLRASLVSVEQESNSRAQRVLYFGEDVFSDLWSGDTRTMIQLITDVIDQAIPTTQHSDIGDHFELPVKETIQDRVFRNRGGEWLNSHTRNEPTDPTRVKTELAKVCLLKPDFRLQGEYGDHLKAVVEAFVAAATQVLLGPMYSIREGETVREVPRMAFRIEIVDEFRINGLAYEIYRDLIRYGLFMRDSRGKSVRGNFVPRLYLRRLLLPISTLALSKRDSVSMTCATFEQLLLEPDVFKVKYSSRKSRTTSSDQIVLPLFVESKDGNELDPAYDDIGLAVADASTITLIRDVDDIIHEEGL